MALKQDLVVHSSDILQPLQPDDHEQNTSDTGLAGVRYGSLAAKIINGGIAGVTGVLATFPVDLSKTRLQNQKIVDGKRMYNGLIDCLTKVVRNEGFFSLYRGLAPNLVLIVPEKTIKLAVNDVLRGHFSDNGKKPLTITQQILAGAGAGTCQVVITAPMEILKIFGQDSGRLHAMPGGAAIASSSPVAYVWRTHGLRGFYKGVGATIIRDVPFSMIYFPTFAMLNKQGITNENDTPPFMHTLASACVAGATAAVAVNPCDVVKTRLQSMHPAARKYKGVLDCFWSIYSEEGHKSFWRGAQARAITIAPLFGIAQSMYCLGIGEQFLGLPRPSMT